MTPAHPGLTGAGIEGVSGGAMEDPGLAKSGNK